MEKTAQDCERVTAGRITVALIPKAATARAGLQARTSLSTTDLVNRAIIAYDWLDEQVTAGAVLLLQLPDGTTGQVRFL